MENVVRVQHHVTYEAAAESLAAGIAKAKELGVRAGIVVVDSFGEIVAAAKLDGANPKAWRGGLGKALFAWAFPPRTSSRSASSPTMSSTGPCRPTPTPSSCPEASR